MEASVHLNVVEARALPVMNKNTELTDAFAEINFCGQYFKTQVVWDTLNPVFCEETFNFNVTDSDLMLQLLHIRLMDYDPYSTNKVIGKVSISLTPLVMGYPQNSLSGWFPLYDTMQGIRGYLRISVKLELAEGKKKNLFRKSNFHIYTFDRVPFGWDLIEIQALINPILVEDDTEDYFSNFIRSSRSSNEARQSLFRDLYARLSNEMVSMAVSLGSNAVLGFKVSFDIEGETRVIARAIGTCVTLVRNSFTATYKTPLNSETNEFDKELNMAQSKRQNRCSINAHDSSTYHFFDPDNIDLDHSMITLRKNALRYKNGIYNQPICNLKTISNDILGPIEGVVTTMYIRVLENKHTSYMIRLNKNWWEELRIELRRQCMNLNCDMIGGYSEVVTMHNKLMAIVSYGTAFINKDSINASTSGESICSPCHSSLNSNSDLFRMKYFTCQLCKSATVPELIICNLLKPDTLETDGLGCFVQTCIYRKFNDNNKENECFQLSQDLTFAYYDLLNKLIHKIKVMGFNSLFNLTIDVSMNDDVIVFTVTGTCYLLKALPIPCCPIIEITTSSFQNNSTNSIDQLLRQICEHISKIRKYINSAHEFDHTKLCVDHETQQPTSDIIIKVDDENPCRYISRLLDPLYLDANSYYITNSHSPTPAITNTNNCSTQNEDNVIVKNTTKHSFVINLIRRIAFNNISSMDIPENKLNDSYLNEEFNVKLEMEINETIEYLYFKLRHFTNCSIHNVHIEIFKNDYSFFLRLFANIECLSEDNSTQLASSSKLLSDAEDKEEREIQEKFDTFLKYLHTPSIDSIIESSQSEDSISSENDNANDRKVDATNSRSSLLELNKSHSEVDNVNIDFSDVNISCSHYFPNPDDHLSYEHIGILSFIFIRETTDIKKKNSIGIVSFINNFFDDVQEIAKAYAKSLNACYILGLNMSDFQIEYQQDVSEAYCLCQVSGNMFTKKWTQTAVDQ